MTTAQNDSVGSSSFRHEIDDMHKSPNLPATDEDDWLTRILSDLHSVLLIPRCHRRKTSRKSARATLRQATPTPTRA